MPTTDRIVDITEGPVSLRHENSLLVFSRKGMPDASIPSRDIGVLVLSTPYVTLTQAAVAALAKEGVCVVFSDQHSMPAAMCLPFGAHFQPAARFLEQAEAGAPLRKRLWKQIVVAKLAHQAALLKHLHGSPYGLDAYPSRVRSGDTTNVEAQGAKVYWANLFGEHPFTRDRDARDVNMFLNYGYTVLRAITARAICAAGLHPGLGVHHHHRDNSFCLADDLMEPFRVYVDHAAYKLTEGGKLRFVEMTKDGKAHIIKSLLAPIAMDGRNETLFYVIQRLAGSLVDAYAGRDETLRLPHPGFS
ncbi:MAG: CRISPR-associated endonuclease Cas1 [Betaproteobacteria bacterium ADurb.Bin341]|nr:MAG: CRISPR-associated endonuclease Cas1 [Betaproteobacteria bacterium ADurb.Bin341]